MPRSILVVDDDKELCSELAAILSDEGFLVDVANDGLQGDIYIRENKYDVILLDFKIPGLNGLELLKRIKAKNTGGKVFLISGRPFLEKLLNETEFQHLVSAVFSKPFDVELLLAKIKE